MVPSAGMSLLGDLSAEALVEGGTRSTLTSPWILCRIGRYLYLLYILYLTIS